MIDCECYWPNSRQRWIQRAVERWKKIIVKKTSFQFAPGKHKPQCQQHLMQLLRQCFRMCWWNHSRQYCNQFGMHWRHYIRQHPQHNMNSVQVLPIELHCSNHNIEAIKKEQIFWCHINERCYASYAFCDKIYPRIVCRKVKLTVVCMLSQICWFPWLFRLSHNLLRTSRVAVCTSPMYTKTTIARTIWAINMIIKNVEY